MGDGPSINEDSYIMHSNPGPDLKPDGLRGRSPLRGNGLWIRAQGASEKRSENHL